VLANKAVKRATLVGVWGGQPQDLKGFNILKKFQKIVDKL